MYANLRNNERDVQNSQNLFVHKPLKLYNLLQKSYLIKGINKKKLSLNN